MISRLKASVISVLPLEYANGERSSTIMVTKEITNCCSSVSDRRSFIFTPFMMSFCSYDDNIISCHNISHHTHVTINELL